MKQEYILVENKSLTKLYTDIFGEDILVKVERPISLCQVFRFCRRSFSSSLQ